MKINVTVITEYHVLDELYYIFKTSNKKYCAINSEYITDGKLNKELNGLQMNLSDTMEQAVNSATYEANFKLYRKAGYEMIEASVLASGGTLAEALEAQEKYNKLFAK